MNSNRATLSISEAFHAAGINPDFLPIVIRVPGNHKISFVLSKKEDCYFITTIDSCSCDQFISGMRPCPHQIRVFGMQLMGRRFSREMTDEKIAEEEWRKVLFQFRCEEVLDSEADELERERRNLLDQLAEKEWLKVVHGGQEEEFDWQKEQRRREILEKDELQRDRRAEEEWLKMVQGEQEEDCRYNMEDEKTRALENEDYWKEIKVSTELGDYDFLQYRCEEDLDPELEWEQQRPQEQQAKEDWLVEQQEKEFRAIQREEADWLKIHEVDEDARSEDQQKDADEEADWLMIQEENAQSRDLQGEKEWRKIQLQDQLDEKQAEEEWRKMQQENEAIPDLREEWWEMHQIADELTQEEELRKVLLQRFDLKNNGFL